MDLKDAYGTVPQPRRAGMVELGLIPVAYRLRVPVLVSDAVWQLLMLRGSFLSVRRTAELVHELAMQVAGAKPGQASATFAHGWFDEHPHTRPMTACMAEVEGAWCLLVELI